MADVLWREQTATTGGSAPAAAHFRRATDSACIAEWRPLADLAATVEPWRRLACRAIEPNVFYDPAFALPAAAVFGADAGAVLVWADAARQTLSGLFPARIADWRSGFPLPVTLGWVHPYAPLGTPLVDRDRAGATIAAWLDFVRREPAFPDCVLLPFLPIDGPFAAALTTALAASGGSLARFARHDRALLAPGKDRVGYLDHAVSAKKRKELGRQRRRLGDAGEVVTVVAGDPREVADALDAFMVIEQGGWKGRAGTAAVQTPEVRDFMQQAMAGLAQRGQVRVVRLESGGRAVAAGILLQSGATGWFWKIAYEEDAAHASPGVQLALDITRVALCDPSLARVDSCATADHPMIDHLWRERLPLADHLFAVDGSARRRFALTRTAETLRRGAFGAARALRNRLRR